MTPGQASKNGAVLHIAFDDMVRRAAHVYDFDSGQGIGFIDAGWSQAGNTSHVEHVIQGEPTYIEGAGWAIESPEYGDVAIWVEDGKPEGDRAQARKLLEQTFPDLAFV